MHSKKNADQDLNKNLEKNLQDVDNDNDLLGFVGNKAIMAGSDGKGKVNENTLIQPQLQGKKVIVKFNSTSGKNLLVLNNKNGETVEIPTTSCCFVKIASPITTPVATKHHPPILKRYGSQPAQIESKATNSSNDHDYMSHNLDKIPQDSINFLSSAIENTDMVLNKSKTLKRMFKLHSKVNYKMLKFNNKKGQKKNKIMSDSQLLQKIPQLVSLPTLPSMVTIVKKKEHKKISRGVQAALNPIIKDAETNTDESLFQEYILSKLRDNAVENLNPVSIKLVEPMEQKPIIDQKEKFYSFSPFEDENFIENAIMGENANFGIGPVMEPVHITTNFDIPMDLEFFDLSQENMPSLPKIYTEAEKRRILFFLDLKNCNHFDADGNTPLHVAVMEDNLNRVKRQCFALNLRRFSIDLNNFSSHTPLQLALINNASVPIVEHLIYNKPNPKVVDPDGNTIIHLAVMYSDNVVLQILLANFHCVDVNAVNSDGDTALVHCARNKKHVKAETLLSAGTNPNIGDKKSGRTPLFHAVEENDIEMVKILLRYKAQSKIRNYSGISPHDALFELDNVHSGIKELIFDKEYLGMLRRKKEKRRKEKTALNKKNE